MQKIIFIIAIICFSCKNVVPKPGFNEMNTKDLKLEYAKGFSVSDLGVYKVITIHSPWPESKTSHSYVVIHKDSLPKITLNPNDYSGIIELPIKKIVVTSTTHLPALELLSVNNTLVGFPGLDYISSKKIRKQINANNIKELGKNEVINTEILLSLNPDVVVGFGIDGGNRAYETIKKSGIPVIFNGDWVESSPLAKAEWIKFFGVLYDKNAQADSIFKMIKTNYLEVKQLANHVKSMPRVLSGAMHNDIWYLPNGASTEAQLLKDANVNYLWNDTKGAGSLKLSFESVFIKAKNAEIWLSPSNYNSLKNLKKGSEHHALFDAFRNKNVYSFTNTTGDTGGILYFELGMTRPDIVLKDLIKISHPELLKNHELYFFKRLE